MGQIIKKIRYWRRKKTPTRGTPENDRMKKLKDIAERAGKTFLQTFLASIPVDAAMLVSGWGAWRAVLLSATAAGISAVMNLAIAALNNKKEENNGRI